MVLASLVAPVLSSLRGTAVVKEHPAVTVAPMGQAARYPVTTLWVQKKLRELTLVMDTKRLLATPTDFTMRWVTVG